MEHKTLEQLQRIAVVHPDQSRPAMTRTERLEHWAQLLERDPERRLTTLHATEFRRRQVRDQMRSEGSPMSVAADDPVLRAEGLTGDTYGEARRFFELSDAQMHEIVCYCHAGISMSAAVAARRVRAAINTPVQSGTFSRLRDALSW